MNPSVPQSSLSLFISRLQFWLLLFLGLNALGLVLMTLRDVWSQPNAASFFELMLGFFLQVPAILLCAATDFFLIRMAQRLPFSGVWQFLVRFVFLYLFLLLYIASVIIYLAVGVFISFEVISIFILDFEQLLPLLITSVLMPLVLLVLVNLLLLFAGRKWTLLTFPYLQRFMLPTFAVGVFLFLCSGVFSLLQSQNDARFAQSVMRNTFPSTFLLGQLVDNVSHSKGEVMALTKEQLRPQLTLSEYRQQAGDMKAKPPVILIMLESISWDHLGFTGYPRRDISRNLDTLFAQSTFFDRTYTPSNHSNLAQGSILSSQYSLRRIRLETFQKVDFVKPMLFDILHEYGYETALYSAQNEDWLGMRRFIESRNARIDHFKHALDFDQHFQFYDRKIDDADLVDEALSYLRDIADSTKPQMLYVNLQRTHFDYRLKPDVKGHYGDIDGNITGVFFDYGEHQVEKAQLQYDNALFYVDQQLGRFFEGLKAQGLYDEALIIVTADHGEAFYQKGYATHATSMYDPQIRTFTSIKLPGQTVGEYRHDAISSVDILPMALEALKLPNHPGFQGLQLLKRERTQGQPIFSTGQSVVRADAVIEYPWKYFVSEKEGGVLLNLDKDPGENNNLLLLEPDVAERLQLRMSQYRQYQLDYYQGSEQLLRDTYYAPQYDFPVSPP